MIGLIHTILFDLIVKVSDEKMLENIKNESNVPIDKDFRIDNNYPNEEWQRLLASTMKLLNLTEQEACDAYAQQFHDDSLKRWSMWYEMSKNSKEFLSRQPKIHNQFATGLRSTEERDSVNDKQIVTLEGNILTNIYKSPNKLCILYKSLAQVIASHYNDTIEVTEDKCMHDGDDHCHINIEWKFIKNG